MKISILAKATILGRVSGSDRIIVRSMLFLGSIFLARDLSSTRLTESVSCRSSVFGELAKTTLDSKVTSDFLSGSGNRPNILDAVVPLTR